MANACRSGLEGLAPEHNRINPFGHPGLGLSRYLHHHATEPEKRDNERPEIALLESARSSLANTPYIAAFKRWKEECNSAKRLIVPATTAGPLAVGLGTASPLEIGITVHHTYGVPVIPGSAVKGLCVCGAKDQDLKRIDLFGDQKHAGCVVFHDAWYDPSTPADAKGKPFHRDVITAHHQGYYGSGGVRKVANGRDVDVWPTDFDDPVPNAFLVVRPGAGFLFAIDCPEGWRDFVGKMLKHALENLGVGAKTNAGYGRFKDICLPEPPAPPWKGVVITRNRRNGELTAHSGNLTASEWGTAAKSLFDRLPASMQAILTTGNPTTADVRVEPRGNSLCITEVAPPGTLT